MITDMVIRYLSFAQVEYARCCLRLVKYKENDNEINEAAKILQEVQVNYQKIIAMFLT